jgi:hypothetical protein
MRILRDAARRDENTYTERWDKVVKLIQHIFLTGKLPTELSWSVLIAIPKVSGGFRGIGILEAMWKVISSIIDWLFKEIIQCHPSLHGFRPVRGTNTASVEAKLRFQLATIH